MEQFADVVQDLEGNAIQGASVEVWAGAGNSQVDYKTPATVYDENGHILPNSTVSTGPLGEFAFSVPNGKYVIRVTVRGTVYRTIGPKTFYDPADDDQRLTLTDLSSAQGFSRIGTPEGTLADTLPLYSKKSLLSAPNGAESVGFIQDGIGAVPSNVIDQLRNTVTPKQFGAKGNGSADDTDAFRKAAAHLIEKGGGRCYIPAGVYKITGNIKTGNNVIFFGDGDSSQLLVNSDIEVFTSDATNPSSAIFRAEFRDFFINNTFTGSRTKYDIHLQNACICKFDGVHIASGHSDTSYSSTNVGGIFLDKPDASTSASYMNRIKDCWIERNSIYCKNVTDTTITGGFVWGHVRQFAIRFQGGGANAVEKVEGIICSKFNGGIWLDGNGINQMRIHGNEFDGNPALDTGTGIYSPDGSIATSITGNTLWGCDKHGIHLVDPIGATISGNSFWKNNAADNFYDDIRIEGKTFQPNGNVVSGNTHVIDDARTNKGYAIREVNAGFSPVNNSYTGNGVQGQGYLSPTILTLSAVSLTGNVGKGIENLSRMPGTSLILGANGLALNTDFTLASSGYYDFVIGTDSYVGILNIALTRSDYLPQSRRAIYMAMAYGANGVYTLMGTVQDGSGGGATFTLSSPSSGVIRITNTSGVGLTGRASFFGNCALG